MNCSGNRLSVRGVQTWAQKHQCPLDRTVEALTNKTKTYSWRMVAAGNFLPLSLTVVLRVASTANCCFHVVLKSVAAAVNVHVT